MLRNMRSLKVLKVLTYVSLYVLKGEVIILEEKTAREYQDNKNTKGVGIHMPYDDRKKKYTYTSLVFTAVLIGFYMKCPNICQKKLTDFI